MVPVLLYFFWCGLLMITCRAADMIGPGRWSVIKVSTCENQDDYVDYMDYEISKNRVNRTNDAFKGSIDLKVEITADFAMRMEVCKFTENGCKPYQEINDDSMCEFVKKHAEKNFYDLLTSIGMDPPDCPLPIDKYTIEQFIIDYNDLPKESVYGKFGVNGYIKDTSGTDIACMYLVVLFEEEDDDGDDDGGDE